MPTTPYPPPFRHLDFTDARIAASQLPPKHVQLMRSVQGALSRNAVAQPIVSIDKLTATATVSGVASRKSFADDPAAVVRFDSREKRMHFAPVAETLRVSWEIKGAALVTLLSFEVYMRNVAGPLFSATLSFVAGQCPARGSFDFDGRLNADVAAAPVGTTLAFASNYVGAQFPGDALSVEHGPYKLKLVVGDPGNALLRTVPARWIYVDVLLGKPTLDWAPRTALANSPHLPTNGVAPVQRDHQVYDSLTDALDVDNLSGAVPQPGQTKRVYLQANVFYQQVAELDGNAGWQQFYAVWGDGPNIPLLLTPAVLSSDDQRIAGAAAIPALGALTYVWEWVDKAAPARGDLYAIVPSSRHQPAQFTAGQTTAQRFLDQAAQFSMAASSPPGRNCHVERGGKRGTVNAPLVFPLQANGGTFPFTVTKPALGNWAALSTIAAAGAHAGKTGVIFQPSIQPGDAYQLRVGPVCADLVDPGSAHLFFNQKMTDMPVSVRFDSGNFVIWKTVEHTVYNGNPAGIGPAHCAGLASRFEKLFIRVRNVIAPIGNYTAALNAMYNGVAPSAANLELPLQIALAGQAAHTNAAIAVYFKTWQQFTADLINHHGGAPAAYLWADGYAAPGLWRDASGKAPFAPEWPVQIVGYANNPVANDHSVQVQLTGASAGVPAVTKTLNAANPAALRDLVRAFVNGFYYDNGTCRAADPAITAQLQCDPADRVAVANEIAAGMTAGHVEVLTSRYEYALGYAWGFRVLELVLGDLVGQQDGLMTFQFEKPNNIGPAPSAKAGFASASRASLYMYMLKTDEMTGTMCHEFGHAMFVNHQFYEQPANDPRELHDDAQPRHCTMSTPAAERNYCGLCMLRLRAWSIYKLDPARQPEPVVPVPVPVRPDMHVRTLTKVGANNSR